MPDHDADDLPWNEAQWEKLMRESDVRSAKFGELLETLGDHPDAEAIIAREMGWDRHKSTEESDDEEPPFDPSAEIEEMSEEEWAEIEREEQASLEAIPAYSQSYAFGNTVWQELKPLMDAPEADDDEDLVDATGNCHLIAAKLAGAHGMGYEDDVLCGNIVNCKVGLTAAKDCLAALERLRLRSAFSAEVLDRLIAECRSVHGLVEQHIAELRSRVWWQ